MLTYRKQKEQFMEIVTKFPMLDAIRQGMRVGMMGTAGNEDFEAKLDKSLNRLTLIKVEPERIALLIARPDGTMEKLIWGKSK